MAETVSSAIDWTQFAQYRSRLGSKFVRVVSYLRDDGARAVAAIESAMRANDAVAIIGPADFIRGEALALGAIGLAELAEYIELSARDCVEWRQSPENLIPSVVALRRVFGETVAAIDAESNPLARKGPRELRTMGMR